MVWHVVKDYAARLGVPKLAPHDVRRSCARLGHVAGGELQQIQFLLGTRPYTQQRNTSPASSACGVP